MVQLDCSRWLLSGLKGQVTSNSLRKGEPRSVARCMGADLISSLGLINACLRSAQQSNSAQYDELVNLVTSLMVGRHVSVSIDQFGNCVTSADSFAAPDSHEQQQHCRASNSQLSSSLRRDLASSTIEASPTWPEL